MHRKVPAGFGGGRKEKDLHTRRHLAMRPTQLGAGCDQLTSRSFSPAKACGSWPPPGHRLLRQPATHLLTMDAMWWAEESADDVSCAANWSLVRLRWFGAWRERAMSATASANGARLHHGQHARIPPWPAATR